MASALQSSTQDERRELIDSLRGEHVHIPDLHHLLGHWPAAINPNIDPLRSHVDQILKTLFPPGKRRSKLRAADPALFAASWWPYASLEKLCTATSLAIWLFAWDDETDSLEFSQLATNFQEAQLFRAITVHRVRVYLALETEYKVQDATLTLSETRNSIISQFAPVGSAIVEYYDLDQRQALMRQIELFIQASEAEQSVQLSGRLPSVESYQRRRMGTSAVAVCLAIHEYALDIQLPRNILDSPMMDALWEKTNVIISVVNDILSIKKETAQGQVDSLVPLLHVAYNYRAQPAMDHAIAILGDAVLGFDLAANALIEDVTGDKILEADLTRFIDSCRYACTANLNWSLRSGRYHLNIKDIRGGVDIIL